ncbi:hypothetical protein HFP72_28680 [Nocardiopsis sp. ARC36]
MAKGMGRTRKPSRPRTSAAMEKPLIFRSWTVLCTVWWTLWCVLLVLSPMWIGP